VLVEGGHVSGWDDPRLPTLRGLRRRGYVPEAIRDFSLTTGISKYPAVFEIQRVEHHLRQQLNKTSPRMMGVLDPVKVVIDNYPEDSSETLEAINNPEDPEAGTRDVPFGRELYIEREDFMEDPPRKFFRLSPGREVRLRYAYFVTCTGVIKDDEGNITEIHCTYDPETRGGDAPDGRKVKATLHWVSAEHALDVEARLYDHLFISEDPEDVEEGQDFTANLNPNSLEVRKGCKVEPSLASARPFDRYQFERIGYFCVDPDSTDGSLVFNRTVGLRDTWKKMQKQQKQKK
jgi:glutaminyl-tRNA synthetase